MAEPCVKSSGELIDADGTCVECLSCVRSCPVHAIRLASGSPNIDQKRCVVCGRCVAACPADVFSVRDDTHTVRELIGSGRSVIALLASEFPAALWPMTLAQIQHAAEAVGFDSVETTVLGEELVASAYEQHYAHGTCSTSLRSTCPVAVDFVRKHHPAFTSALAPIVPPYIAQARLIRSLYREDVAIVYVSPCYARKDEIRDPEFAGDVDAAIGFDELKRLFAEGGAAASGSSREASNVRGTQPRKKISLTDGFPRSALALERVTEAGIAVVRSLDALGRLLEAIEAGETCPAVIDMLYCDGCLDGPTVDPGLSLFAKRDIQSRAREEMGDAVFDTAHVLRLLPPLDLTRVFTPEPLAQEEPDASEIDAVLELGGYTRDTVLDCGACGWPTCAEHGAVRERLKVELERAKRYGTQVCLAMIDVEGLAALGEAYGEAAAQRVLTGLSSRLADEVRSTDTLVGYDSRRFALILPETSKTEAFAAAERLREVIRSTAEGLLDGGYTHDVTVTASVGVASATAANDIDEFVEAACSALSHAIREGGDQVRLALG